MFIKTSGAKAQLAAKDEIIRTNEQSIESLEKRLTTLESEFAKAGIKIAQLGDDLLVSKTENEHLRKYTAPEIAERLLKENDARFAELVSTLKGIEDKLP